MKPSSLVLLPMYRTGANIRLFPGQCPSSVGAHRRMPSYRATFRYGGTRPQYEMLDIEADDLRAALTAAAEQVSEAVAETAELVEIRRQTDPDDREYTPE